MTVLFLPHGFAVSIASLRGEGDVMGYLASNPKNIVLVLATSLQLALAL